MRTVSIVGIGQLPVERATAKSLRALGASVVRLAMQDAGVERARSGEGPTFIECLTYRLRGHYEGDPAKYRELSEISEWKAKDPIARLANALKEKGILSEKEISEAEPRARKLVDEAVQFALAAPWPDAGDLTSQVFVGG